MDVRSEHHRTNLKGIKWNAKKIEYEYYIADVQEDKDVQVVIFMLSINDKIKKIQICYDDARDVYSVRFESTCMTVFPQKVEDLEKFQAI